MNNSRGFTLVEILAAITILFIVGTAFFQFFIMSQKGTVESAERLEALHVAQQVMEQVKQQEYKNKGITSPGEYTCNNLPQGQCTFTINNKLYEVKIIVHDHEHDLYLVKVEVYDEDGESRSSVQALVPKENF